MAQDFKRLSYESWDDTDSGASPLVLSLALPAGHALLLSHFGRSIAVQWMREDVRPYTRAPPPFPSRRVPRVRFPLSAFFCTGAPVRFHTVPAAAVLPRPSP